MQNNDKKKRINRRKRHNRVRAKVKGAAKRPRLSVYKSNKGYMVQLIDDELSKTIASVSTASDLKDIAKIKVEKKDLKGKELLGYRCGLLLATRAKNIKECIFDKGGFKFHGRIKAVADGARDGGLKF